LVQRTKKARDPLNIENVGELARHPGRAPGPEGLVRELDQGRLVLRSPAHPVQFRLLTPFRRALQDSGPVLKTGGKRHRAVNPFRIKV
jgi:hypothetical protein